MFAFLRVIVFYLGFATLLTWGIFAFGWADALELPGFESAQAPTLTLPTYPQATQATPKLSQSREARQAEGPVEPVTAPETKRVPDTPATPADPRASQPLPPVATAPAPPSREPAPLPHIEVAVAPHITVAPRAPDSPTSAPAASLPQQDSKRLDDVATSTPPPIPIAKLPDSPSSPQAHTADLSPATTPAPRAAPEPIKPVDLPPAMTRAPAIQPVAAATASSVGRRWSPQHRIAGFDADALVDVLEDAKRPPDDVPCVMFRGLAYKAGTTLSVPQSRESVELIADILKATPGARVEIGSRLGPGRPMATDTKLRTDRATDVRERLIGLGVEPQRLTIDTNEAYERVSDDIARARGGRVQSIGLCIHST